MADEKVGVGAIEAVQHLEEAVIETVAEVTQTLTDVAQNNDAFEIFGVPFWESILTFLIVLLIYNLILMHIILCDWVWRI